VRRCHVETPSGTVTIVEHLKRHQVVTTELSSCREDKLCAYTDNAELVIACSKNAELDIDILAAIYTERLTEGHWRVVCDSLRIVD
jgi:hypothetical protein